MNHRIICSTIIASSLVAVALASGTAHAELQGRDLNGSAGSFEAYYDTDLDITWLADANYAQTSNYDADGKMTWDEANTWAANLSFTDGVNVYDDWRLPTVDPVNGNISNFYFSYDGSTVYGYNITSPQSEMAHLFYVTLGNPGYFTTTGAVSGCYVSSANTCLDNIGPFSNLQAGDYWSGTAYGPNGSTYDEWFFKMYTGFQVEGGRGNSRYALAVSPGDVAAVPEAQTYALMLAGLGLIGWRVGRRG